MAERNLLADASKIVEKNKACKRKDDLRKIVTDDLLLLGHDASICKSRWEKSPSFPAGNPLSLSLTFVNSIKIDAILIKNGSHQFLFTF